MKVTHNLRMDLARCSCTPVVNAVQGEGNTRALIISLYDNGAAWEAPAGTTAAVAFKKPDGLCGLYDQLPNGDTAVTIEGSTVTAILAPQALTVPGEVTASVVFYDQDMDRLATFPFRIRVAVDPAGGQHVSNEYYKYSTLEEVNEAVDAALAALEADKQAFLAQAEEVLTLVHDTATGDAPAIVCEATGAVVGFADASDRPLHSLKLYGKTTQDGTPTPEAPVELVSAGGSGAINTTVCGKNLLGGFKSKTENGVTFTVNADGSVHVKGTSLYSTALDTKVHLLPGNYMLSGCPEGGSQAASDGNFTLYMQILSDAGNKYYFDTGRGVVLPISVEGDYAIRILLRANTTIDKTFYPMVEIGNTVTEYEPYKGHTLTASTPNGLPGIPVSSGGNYTDENGQQWICDEIDFARGVYVQRVKERTFDGTEEWVLQDKEFTFFLRDNKALSSSTSFNCISSHYSTRTRNQLYDKQNVDSYLGIAVSGNYIRFVDNVNCNGDTEAFKALLAQQYANGTPVTVQYILAEPIETSLSAEELAQYAALHSYKPTTTIYNDAGAGLAVEYVADTKNYIDQKLAAISAALLNA